MAFLPSYTCRFLIVAIVAVGTVPGFGQAVRDLVHGNLVQFNDNGAWCWYQDERAVVDQGQSMLILGSIACPTGVGGAPRRGDVDAILFNLTSGSCPGNTKSHSMAQVSPAACTSVG